MPTDRAQTLDAVAGSREGCEKPASSYGQILKSSAWIGGSSVLTIVVGIVRTKALAVMLGPSGYGFMALYNSILDLAFAAASMGIGSSGVRQIAESVASGDRDKIARTVVALRRTALVLGILGVALLGLAAAPVSELTFGTAEHASAIALLGLAVLFRLLAAGQGALIQGMRRIQDLAAIGVLGAALGGVASIALVYVFREKGVAPALVAGAAAALIVSWWYSRKVSVETQAVTGRELRQEAGSLLKLGLAFMVSGLLVMGAAYAVRAIVIRADGVEAAGLYSAAWTLGGLYVGIILQAMGADFYPRLVGVAANNRECNRLVNEQTLVSLLLAAPGVVATVVLAPLIILMFYSAEFGEAAEILRWICLGIALRAITWPMGYIIVAQNRQVVFVGAEIAWTIVNVTLTWILVEAVGVTGAGIAFFGSYLFHLALIYPIAHRLTGFTWTRENLKAAAVIFAILATAFLGTYALPPLPGTILGGAAVLVIAGYSIRELVKLMPHARLPSRLIPVLERLRIRAHPLKP